MEPWRKKLTKTDVKYKMSWPAKYLNQLEQRQLINLNNPPHMVDFEVVDEAEQTWTFKCTSRTEGYKKPVITGQWLQFVGFYNLEVGDKITFILNLDPEVPLRVRFEKQELE